MWNSDPLCTKCVFDEAAAADAGKYAQMKVNAGNKESVLAERPHALVLSPDSGTQLGPIGTFGLPKFSSKSRMIFNAFRLLK